MFNKSSHYVSHGQDKTTLQGWWPSFRKALKRRRHLCCWAVNEENLLTGGGGGGESLLFVFLSFFFHASPPIPSPLTLLYLILFSIWTLLGFKWRSTINDKTKQKCIITFCLVDHCEIINGIQWAVRSSFVLAGRIAHLLSLRYLPSYK